MENILWQLTYEQRQSMVEYRDAAQKLTLAGYDLADPDRAISDISQRLGAINTARKSERELAAEYRTLLQIRRYVKLTDEPKFVKGPRWEELSQENAENTKVMTAVEHSPELSTKNQPPNAKEPLHKEPQKRKTIRPEIDI